MSLARWEERLAPLDGIAAVVFWVAGVLVLQGPADQPDTDASAARALAFFKGEENAILVGTFLYMVGTLFFLWFLGLVRTRLVEAEGGSHRVSSIAFAGGVAAAICLLAQPAVHAAREARQVHDRELLAVMGDDPALHVGYLDLRPLDVETQRLVPALDSEVDKRAGRALDRVGGGVDRLACDRFAVHGGDDVAGAHAGLAGGCAFEGVGDHEAVLRRVD